MDDESVEVFLRRLGVEWEGRPTVAALQEIHERYMLAVPFENIDFHLRKPIDLGAGAIDKIVHQGRGGCCFELNGVFSEFLVALGYGVTVLGVRVAEDHEGLGPVMGHMSIKVVAEDSAEPWLADVGYARGFRRPLRLGSRVPQHDPHGVFQVAEGPPGDVDVFRDGMHQYRVEARPRAVADFEAMLWFFRHNAEESPHLLRLYCTRPTRSGRVTITGNTLIRRENDARVKLELADSELGEAYRTWFGFELDEIPAPPA